MIWRKIACSILPWFGWSKWWVRLHCKVAREQAKRMTGLVKQRVVEYLSRSGPASDAKLRDALGLRHQVVNQTCRQLTKDGVIYRTKGDVGSIQNHLCKSSGQAVPQLRDVERRVETIVPPFDGAQAILQRIRETRGLPERNMEALVQDFLLRLGHPSESIMFQVGRIDVVVNDPSGKPLFVFEVKRSLQSKKERDQARRQGFDYAARTGARFVVLTDADRYEIYDRKAGLDHDSMLIGSFQLTKFRREDVALLDELRPTAGTI